MNEATLSIDGRLTNSGALTNDATLSMDGRMTDSGTLMNNYELLVDSTLTVTGALISHEDFGYLFVGGRLIDSGTVICGGVLRVGGTLDVTTGVTADTTFGTVLNDRLIAAGSDVSLTFHSVLWNDPGQHGMVELGVGASATFGNAVNAGQTVRLDGANVISLGDAPRFAATIAGFASGDSIDLNNILASDSSFVDGALSLTEHGGRTIEAAILHFAGAYTSSDFRLHADGHGGTVVTTSATLAGA